MIKLNQAIKVIILSFILTSSCGFKRNSFENYSQTINETLNPASSNLTEIQNISDAKDMRGCGVEVELGVWVKEKRKNREVWKRRSVNYDHGIIGSGNDYLDFDYKDSTPHLTKNPNLHIVYIGPWQYAKKVGKEIRFVALQDIDYKNPSRLNYHGTIRYQFESKTPENQNIGSREFNLLSDATPSRSSVCIVKWIANHGYNSISKVKSKNPFSKNYMVPTGEIIQVED
jgi:hypothetical protein